MYPLTASTNKLPDNNNNSDQIISENPVPTNNEVSRRFTRIPVDSRSIEIYQRENADTGERTILVVTKCNEEVEQVKQEFSEIMQSSILGSQEEFLRNQQEFFQSHLDALKKQQEQQLEMMGKALSIRENDIAALKELFSQQLQQYHNELKELLLQQQNMHNQSALVAQIETLRSRAEVLDRELIKTEYAKQIAQNEINRLNGEINKLINKLTNKKNKYEHKLHEVTRTHTTEIEKIQEESQKKIDQLTKKLEKKKAKLDDLKNQNNSLNENSVQNNQQAQQLQAKITELQEQIQKVQTEGKQNIEQLKQQYAQELNKKETEYRNSLDELKRQLA